MITAASQLGAKVVYRAWLTNEVAMLVPAGRAKTLATLPGIERISLDDITFHATSYGGQQARNQTLTSALLANGYDSNVQNRVNGGTPIRIGVVEYTELDQVNEHWLNGGHVGYRDWVGGPNRVIQQYDCTTGTCSQHNSWAPWSTKPSHGSKVTFIAAGSIEQNQSSLFPGWSTADQISRSGQAREAKIYYYLIHWGADVVAAINRAVADGVDIINMSYTGGNCEGLDHDPGQNPTFKSATDSGVLFVASVGNKGSYSQTECRVGYPAYLPDVIGVTGLDTHAKPNDYNTTILSNGASARGRVPIRLSTGVPDVSASLKGRIFDEVERKIGVDDSGKSTVNRRADRVVHQ